MPGIYIVLLSIANVEEIINRGIALAAEGDHRLNVTFALEKQIPETLSSVMDNIGFLGEVVQEDVKQAIIDNFKARVFVIMEEIDKLAAAGELELTFDQFKQYSMEELVRQIETSGTKVLLVNCSREVAVVIKGLVKEKEIHLELFIDGKSEATF